MHTAQGAWAGSEGIWGAPRGYRGEDRGALCWPEPWAEGVSRAGELGCVEPEEVVGGSRPGLVGEDE